MITKDLEYYISLAGKTVAGYEDIDSSFERFPTMGKRLQRNNSRKEEAINMENFIAVLFLETTAATPTFRNHNSDQSTDIFQKKDYSSLKAQVVVSIF